MWRVDGVMAAMGLGVGGLFVVAWLLGRENLKKLQLECTGARRVKAGKVFPVTIGVRNGRRMLDGFRIEFGVDLAGERKISGRVVWLAGGGGAKIEGRPSLVGRGLGTMQKGWVRSGFPLGLMSFEKRMEVEKEIGVLAREKVPRELSLIGQLMEGVPRGGARQAGESGEWKGLREWRAGDRVRRIAWGPSLRAEAGGGAVLVREDEPPGTHAESCLVVFHSYGSDGKLIRPDRFETALSLLSGTLGMLCGWGMPTRWVADFNNWEERELRTRRQLGRAREELMMAKRAMWTEAHDLEGVLAGAGKHESVVIISDMPPAGWKGMIPILTLNPVVVNIEKYDVPRRNLVRNKRGAK